MVVISVALLGQNKQEDAVSVCTFQKMTTDSDTPVVQCEYFVIGTAIIRPREREPSTGRIIILSCDQNNNGKFRVEAEKIVKGAVYCLKSLNGNIIAGINGVVTAYKVNDVPSAADGASAPGGVPENRLDIVPEYWQMGHTIVVSLDTWSSPTKDHIVVGDLMHGVSLLAIKEEDNGRVSMEEAAHDYNPAWTMSVVACSMDVAIASEHRGNLFVTLYHDDALSEEEKGRLEVVGTYHLGESVNVFRKGSLTIESGYGVTTAGDGGQNEGQIARPAENEPWTIPLFESLRTKIQGQVIYGECHI